jgi:hypothetical protein
MRYDEAGVLKSRRDSRQAENWDIPAAQAAPPIPSPGKGPRPKIRRGSRTAPSRAAVTSAYIE